MFLVRSWGCQSKSKEFNLKIPLSSLIGLSHSTETWKSSWSILSFLECWWMIANYVDSHAVHKEKFNSFRSLIDLNKVWNFIFWIFNWVFSISIRSLSFLKARLQFKLNLLNWHLKIWVRKMRVEVHDDFCWVF